MTIKCDLALICDEVRREDNGKLFVIGVYGSDIQISTFPANLAFFVLAGIVSDQIGEFDFEAKVMAGEKRLAGGRGRIGIKKDGRHLVSLGPFLVTCETELVLDVQLRLGGRFHSIIKIPVHQRPPT